MPPLPDQKSIERLEDVRRAISYDIKAAGDCSDDQSHTAVLDRLAETISQIPPPLLARFDAAWNTDGFHASLRWTTMLADAGTIAVAASASELVERLLDELEAAKRADQMAVARTIMRRRRNVLRDLAK